MYLAETEGGGARRIKIPTVIAHLVSPLLQRAQSSIDIGDKDVLGSKALLFVPKESFMKLVDILQVLAGVIVPVWFCWRWAENEVRQPDKISGRIFIPDVEERFLPLLTGVEGVKTRKIRASARRDHSPAALGHGFDRVIFVRQAMWFNDEIFREVVG